MTFHIFEEKSDIHKNIEMVRLFDLIIFLSVDDKNLIFGVFGGENIHFGVIKGTFNYVKFVGR